VTVGFTPACEFFHRWPLVPSPAELWDAKDLRIEAVPVRRTVTLAGESLPHRAIEMLTRPFSTAAGSKRRRLNQRVRFFHRALGSRLLEAVRSTGRSPRSAGIPDAPLRTVSMMTPGQPKTDASAPMVHRPWDGRVVSGVPTDTPEMDAARARVLRLLRARMESLGSGSYFWFKRAPVRAVAGRRGRGLMS
jgi:hypothetical protein